MSECRTVLPEMAAASIVLLNTPAVAQQNALESLEDVKTRETMLRVPIRGSGDPSYDSALRLGCSRKCPFHSGGVHDR